MEKTINVIKVQKRWLAIIKIGQAQPIHEIGYFDKKGNAVEAANSMLQDVNAWIDGYVKTKIIGDYDEIPEMSQKVKARLLSLSKSKQEHIARKYYGGNFIWQD